MGRIALTHPIVERRRAEQREKIEKAHDYVRRLTGRLAIEGAWIVGSVARGDFNVWSDVDVVIVARDLPVKLLARADLFLDKPAGFQIVAYTPEEFDVELRRNNPLTVETRTVGVALGHSGEEPLDKRVADK
jgi:uncharacterized protein